MGEKFKVLYSEEVISKRVKELAQEIKPYLEKYNSDDIVMVGLLKGVIFFFVDLIRALGSPDYRVELIKASSYQGQESTGRVNIQGEIGNIEDKIVILVDDIIDTGRTFSVLVEYLKERKPKELFTVAFLDKPSRREVDFNVDFVGFSIPNHFVIGYGLDYNEDHRSLVDIQIMS